MTAAKRTIEVDADTADVLEHRAAESGVSVSDLLAELVARHSASAEVSSVDIAELDRQWAEIKAGEPTVPHEEVVHGVHLTSAVGTIDDTRMVGCRVGRP
jgi:hypothetical protein